MAVSDLNVSFYTSQSQLKLRSTTQFGTCDELRSIINVTGLGWIAVSDDVSHFHTAARVWARFGHLLVQENHYRNIETVVVYLANAVLPEDLFLLLCIVIERLLADVLLTIDVFVYLAYFSRLLQLGHVPKGLQRRTFRSC